MTDYPSTPILLCCYLMEQKIDSKPLQQLMVPLMDLLLSAGADPALCGGHDGLSTFSRLFAKISNFGYLESVIRRFVDASNFEDLNLFDTWILATLIRSDPKFYRSLEVQLLEFRTAPSLQTGARSQASLLTNLSLPRQVSEMQQSSSGYRIEFMRALSRHGTAAMLEPILNAGIDINEVNDTEFSYLGEAAKAGNYETLVALVNAGARVEGGTFLPAPDALLQRWVEMDMLFTEKQQRETIEAEFPLLEELIKTPGLRVESMPYTLSRALKVPNEICFKSVLDAGFGVSLRPKPGKQKHTSLFGPAWWELIEAVYLNNYPAVQLLIARGARLEDEDDVGCTALLTAVDNGRPEIIKLLVEAGARVHFRTRKTKSAWDLACKNLLTSHPRRINFDHRQMDHNVRYVPAEVDLQVYSILKKASPKEPKGCRSGSDLDEPYLVEAILDTLIKTRAELSFEYAAIKKSLGRISASTITLVILGLAVTIPVLIIHEAWTGAWRIYRTRSSPAFGQWGALLLIMCFAWWATPSLGQGH
ncbi:hypothetical protein MMC24_005283 [Lignoscripta atroalba]|nr:hypothetical protein [Lignoscripta atroalba]